MENNINPVATPQDAIAQFVGEQYMEWLMNYMMHEVKSWSSLPAIAASKPKPERIKKLMVQRFLAAEAFVGAGKEGDPGFLGFAIANLSEASDPMAEPALEIIENKRREEMAGTGSSADPTANIHHDLWARLLRALGVTDDELKRAEPKEPTRNYIAEMSDIYSNSEWQTTMAAFAAHEKIVPEEYSALMSLLKSNLSISDSDLEILTWHSKADAKYAIEVGHILERISVDKEGKDLVFQGVSRQLEARRDYYEGLLKYLHD